MKRNKILSQVTALCAVAALSANGIGISAFADNTSNTTEGTYVLMNIPYNDFYKAEITNDVRVDGVTSATLQKTRNGGLVSGSFHEDKEGTDITGITYPVKVSNLSDLNKYKQITDSDAVTITTTMKGNTQETKYEGKASLFENGKYSYYVLPENETPDNYKELSFDSNGNPVFSSIKGKTATEVSNASASITGSSRYGDYEVSISDIPFDTSKVYGVILKTEDGKSYGLRHLENIWRGTELAWCTGDTTSVKGNPTDSEHYKSMVGHTIKDIEYITDNGIYNISTNLEVPEYKYLYAGLTWDQYWASENVYLNGTDMKASSDEKDAKGESDKGAFDVVTRATTNHGLHRGSFQCIANIVDEDGNKYNVSHWAEDGSKFYTSDGQEIGYSKGTLTLANGETKKLEHYEVSGIKYVPVKVKASDYDAFRSKYPTIENGQQLVGGYSENKLSAYSETANVTAKTNGIKIAEKQDDGSFKFTKRVVGTDSGIKDSALKKAEKIEATVKPADDAESYGCFIRVDLNGDDYGALGSNMQAVKWEYYGNDETYKNKLATYGTKFAADNWMHKAMGIQLGLTDSLRCQLPENTDGTGYWKLTVYALGYEDYTIKVKAESDNIVKESSGDIDTSKLEEAINNALKLNESDYTAESWATMQTELSEAKDELSTPHSQPAVDEAINHLNAAVSALVKKTVAISSSDVKLNTVTYVYDGKAKNPTVSVKVNNNTLVKDTDYTVSYKNNVNAGTASVTVTGKGSYTSSVTKTFKISPKSISKPTSVTKVSVKTYTGKQIKPSVQIKIGTKTLSANKDYSVTYGVNKIGKGTITITGKGNYIGKFVRTFSINPRSTTASVTSKSRKLIVSVAKKSEATKYQIAYSTRSDFKGAKILNTKSLKSSVKATAGKKYFVKVRTVKTVGKTNYTSKWSSVKSVVIKK